MNILLLFATLSTSSKAFQKTTFNSETELDSNKVIELNKNGYSNRLTSPDQSINIGRKAISIAKKINYQKGIAEGYRVTGIGYYYTNNSDSALNNYLISLNIFKKIKDEIGEAKVSSNIGNLWAEIDYDKSLEYFNQTLVIANKHSIKDLIAGTYLNIGNAYYRKKNYSLALSNYTRSNSLFKKINNPIGITQSLQNIGVIYFYLNNFDVAEKTLLEANKKSKENELNNTIATINLTLSTIYINKNNFKKAEQYINEGIGFAKLVNNQKLIYDYTYTNYELESKRKNYEKALEYLKEINALDSINYKKNTASNINLIQQTLKQQQTQKENELTIQAQINAQKLAFAIGAVTIMAFLVIFLLIKTNKRSKKSNSELTALNNEVIKQKNNVDRINHQLEEIIGERTKDLIIKNQKLSEYSSHLSHQIRGPVATLKGLMMLVEDKLVDSNEIAPQIKKCVDDIDSKIMTINEDLHDPTRKGLS
ncbi:tetratricopeptide repeat protein [Pedobacter alpinus]|uniref:Tetratricopeptide repeat protein n=1 Tax=Pedobacter alpinus TaxID=1590643 RepID=A0ABW5TX68_9SPHI